MADTNYYNWFKKIIDICIYCFYVFAFISTVFVFCSFLSGAVKYIAVFCTTAVIGIVAYFFKGKIRSIIEKLINKLKRLNRKQLALILGMTAVLLKTIYSVFFFFDTTTYGGDITVYTNIAESIVTNGISSVTDYIYYLVGMGIHLSIFKSLSLPYHIGMFIVFLIATMVNYFSFSKLIGKEKSFLLLMLYIAMPSTCLLTCCITHELFVYLYFSLILGSLNLFLNDGEIKKNIVTSIFLFLFISLNSTVSPIGKIWFIVLPIIILLTNIDKRKKLILCVIFALSLTTTNYLSTKLEGNTQSQSNNYEQLLIGSDLNSMGRHTDGKGKNAAREYWAARGVELTYENLVEGEKGALIEQYKYLLSHPLDLLNLLVNKFYVVWSGDYYSVEFAYLTGAISTPLYYLMLVISALIWLFIMTLSVVYYVKKEENISVNTYKLVILGIMAVLLITEVTNKYSCYMSAFIYFIAIARTDLNGGSIDE